MRQASRRAAVSIALAALFAAPSAMAYERGASASGASGLSVGLGIGPGLWLDGGPAAFELALRGGVDIPLSNRLQLRLALPLRFSTWSYEYFNERTSAVAFAIIPTLQLGIRAIPQLQLYLSGGVGPSFERYTTEVFWDRVIYYDDGAYLEVDMTFGLEYAFDQRFALYFEPMGLRMFPGYPNATVWTMMVGANVRL